MNKPTKEQNFYRCPHIGVQQTTPVYFQITDDGSLEARCGVSIIGHTNMTEEQLKFANPFDDSFRDNYASGTGTTKDVALANLENDMHRLSQGLF